MDKSKDAANKVLLVLLLAFFDIGELRVILISLFLTLLFRLLSFFLLICKCWAHRAIYRCCNTETHT